VKDERMNPQLSKSFALEQYCRVGDVNRAKETLDKLARSVYRPDRPLPGAILAGASENGHTNVVKLLLVDPRIDPATRGYDYPITIASRRGHVSIVELLLADPRVDPAPDSNNNPIRDASGRGLVSVVKLLLADPRVDPSLGVPTALEHAISQGHVSIVKLLLADPRVDPAADDNERIRYASRWGHASIVKLLLADSRVDPTADDNYAIKHAALEGHASIVKLLLADPRVDPSMGHPTALERASRTGSVEVVQMLLAHPKVVVTKAALVAADKRDHGDIVRLLIEKQPRMLQTMFASATPCKPGGALEGELRRRERASALALLLAVERFEGLMRVSDVLRDVVVEYACFDLIGMVADDSASSLSGSSMGSSPSDDSFF
jgi:ankyrin repeat protein